MVQKTGYDIRRGRCLVDKGSRLVQHTRYALQGLLTTNRLNMASPNICKDDVEAIVEEINQRISDACSFHKIKTPGISQGMGLVLVLSVRTVDCQLRGLAIRPVENKVFCACL